MSEQRTPETQTDRCPRCQEWKLHPERCQCKRFEAAEPFNGEVHEASWSSIYARDAEEAAEKWAERSDCDSAEYSIIRAGEGEVWTRDENGVVQKWDILAEAVPTYNAREIT